MVDYIVLTVHIKSYNPMSLKKKYIIGVILYFLILYIALHLFIFEGFYFKTWAFQSTLVALPAFIVSMFLYMFMGWRQDVYYWAWIILYPVLFLWLCFFFWPLFHKNKWLFAALLFSIYTIVTFFFMFYLENIMILWG
jgi:hypothetical protein